MRNVSSIGNKEIEYKEVDAKELEVKILVKLMEYMNSIVCMMWNG